MRPWTLARKRSARLGAVALTRRLPVTSAVVAVTAAASIPALWWSPLVRALEQDPALVARGQWWRIISPLLVQGYGAGQFLVNMLGIVLVGSAVERRYGRWRWLATYLGSGMLSIAVTSLWFPQWRDSGSSTGVAGLIGAVVVALIADRSMPPIRAIAYAVFFGAYLTLSQFDGRAVTLGVALAVAVGALADRYLLGGRLLRTSTAATILVAAAALLSIRDIHGVGLAAGIVISAAVRPPEGECGSKAARSVRTRSISARR